jgi:hypothetical protein
MMSTTSPERGVDEADLEAFTAIVEDADLPRCASRCYDIGSTG